MSYSGLPFPDIGCPVPDVYIYYDSGMIDVCDTFSTFIYLHWIFLLMDILFQQRIGWYIMGPPGEFQT